jgi:hypothetical protein
MSWRNMVQEDIKRGTIIRLGSLENDGAYDKATIIAEHYKGDVKYITVARPYAYAHKDFNSNSPLIGSENFAILIESLLKPESDVQVFQGRDDVRSMLT